MNATPRLCHCVDDRLVCRSICSCIPDGHVHWVHETATCSCDDTRGCVLQFWPPVDEHMCSKHIEAWNFYFKHIYHILYFILNIFISVFNQLDAQDLFYNKFYFAPLHVSSTCAHHHHEVKIALHSLWYHHAYRWPSRLLCVDDRLVCRSTCSCISEEDCSPADRN